MKKFLFCCLFIFFSTAGLIAQDIIIIMRNGDEIKSKVIEIGISEIKYKKFDNPEGPVISVFKSEVFMIKYENGTKDVFKQETDKTKKQPVTNEYIPSVMIYAGLSIPVGDFSHNSNQINVGFAGGMEGIIDIKARNAFFNYDLGYLYNPSSSYYKYHTLVGLLGFRFQGTSSIAKVYFSMKGGGNLTWYSNSDGIGPAFNSSLGVILNEHANLGIKFLYGKMPRKSDPITALQIIFGYEF